MQLLGLINPEHVTEEEVQGYSVREAARAVVTDAEGAIALLHVVNEQYYKLPGGGIEDGEDRIRALVRECLEEIGCYIEVVCEVGKVVEYRKIFTLKQTSYCYVACVRGPKGAPEFTQSERDKGFEVVWMPYRAAQEALRNSTPSSFEGKHYIVPRDVLLLEAAGGVKDVLDKSLLKIKGMV